MAYMAGDNLEWISRFAAQAHDHITRGGCLACVFGDAANVPSLVALIEEQGWAGSIVARRDLLLEELTVYRFQESGIRNQESGIRSKKSDS